MKLKRELYNSENSHIKLIFVLDLFYIMKMQSHNKNNHNT